MNRELRPYLWGKSRPCIIFNNEIDVTDPEDMANFMLWLYELEYPYEPGDIDFANPPSPDPEQVVEGQWGFQAPAKRMMKLLWQKLQSNFDDSYFDERFMVIQEYLIRDATSCGKILSPIKEKLHWVFEGYQRRLESDRQIGQGQWGEEWWLPKEQAEHVRSVIRKARPDLLEKVADYDDGLLFALRWTLEECGAVDIPCQNPDRAYVGKEVHDKYGRYRVQISLKKNHYELWRPPDGLGCGAWGYFGAGPGRLAKLILTDATGGDIWLGNELREDFAKDIVSSLPDKEFRLPWSDVAAWLAKHGYTQDFLVEHETELGKRKQEFKSRIDEIQGRLDQILHLDEPLRVQRFDLVPPDFECALYLDFVEMLRKGGYTLRCGRCQLPIGMDDSTGDSQRRSRWERGLPVYHDECARKQRLATKRKYWHRKAQDPKFQKKEKRRAAEYRRLYGTKSGRERR